uniref:Ubiquilin-1 n=1 Tax=Neospora caninum (strain Liverpool) TaxID=572307 RepID=A0A0F7U7Q2_NEOCL|nr:TPA: Ubiquilin-1 [Neospora caninum Liverpool]
MEGDSPPRPHRSPSESSSKRRDASSSQPASPLSSSSQSERSEASLTLEAPPRLEKTEEEDREKRETKEREDGPSEDESKEGEKSEASSAIRIPVSIKVFNGGTTNVHVDPSISVDEWRNQLEPIVHIPPHEQRLVASGRVLQGCRLVSSYGLRANGVVHLLRNRPAAGREASSAVGTSSTGQSTSRGISSNQIRGLGAAAPGPGEGDAQRDFVQQLMQSSLMNQLTESPDFLQMVMESNPQLQQLREQNPELNHLLSDPQIFRQSIQMARNPALLREMMRSTDRAMANIEALPGGFHALMRMYHTIQEPMYAATIDAAASDSVGAAETQQAYEISRRVETVEAMPNPWAPRSSPSETPAASQFDQLLRRSRVSESPSTGGPANGSPEACLSFPGPFGFPVDRMRLSSSPRPPQPPSPSPPGGSAPPSTLAAEGGRASSERPASRPIRGEGSAAATDSAREAAASPASNSLPSGEPPERNPLGGGSEDGDGAGVGTQDDPSFRLVMDLLRSSLRNSRDMRQVDQTNRGAAQTAASQLPLGGPGLLGMLSPFALGSAPFAPPFSPPTRQTSDGERAQTSIAPQVPQDEASAAASRYAVQLDTLRSMGFTDTAQCIRALETVGGNLNRAIDLLLAQQTQRP